jgi:two-component system response regulator GlrR
MLQILRSFRRVLVIEGDSESSSASVHLALAQDATLQCDRIGWDTVHLQDIGRHHLDLVVVVADAISDEVSSTFEWLERHATAPVIAILPDGDEELLHLAISLTDDFLFAPIRPVELRHRAQRLLTGPRHDLEDARRRLVDEVGFSKLVGKDAAFLRAIRLVPRLARTDATVLITGETGTGKELCAGAIHHLSQRRDAPFIPVDCGAVPDQLFENELFGHARGAFTDAYRDQKGLVALADGGTLFLDEIDTLSPSAQAKLLRFLEERSFRPLGAERRDRANVRIIAATNRNVDACVRDGQLRADLYFRLNILKIHLPPLRERRDDIALLAYKFLDGCRSRGEACAKALSSSALRMLALYAWPGNVRELLNVVQRAVVECDGDTILPQHIDLPVPVASGPVAPLDFRAARAAAVATFERQYVEDLLRKHDGNVTHAAREARQDRRAFGRVIKKYNIDRESL